MFSEDADKNKVIQETIKRVEKGDLPAYLIQNTIDLVRSDKLDGTKILHLKEDNSSVRKMLFSELIARFSSGAGFWAGTPEYNNIHFRNVVSDLAKIDTNDIGRYPQVEDRIIGELVLAHLRRVDNCYEMIGAIMQYFFDKADLVSHPSRFYMSKESTYTLVQASLDARFSHIMKNLVIENCNEAHGISKAFEGISLESPEIQAAMKSFSECITKVAYRLSNGNKHFTSHIVLNEDEKSQLAKIKEVLARNGMNLESSSTIKLK
jgi:hypothetical protein